MTEINNDHTIKQTLLRSDVADPGRAFDDRVMAKVRRPAEVFSPFRTLMQIGASAAVGFVLTIGLVEFGREPMSAQPALSQTATEPTLANRLVRERLAPMMNRTLIFAGLPSRENIQ